MVTKSDFSLMITKIEYFVEALRRSLEKSVQLSPFNVPECDGVRIFLFDRSLRSISNCGCGGFY